MTSNATSIDPSISFKNNNQKLIVLAHNPIYYTWTKHIDIQYNYIGDKIATEQINLK